MSASALLALAGPRTVAHRSAFRPN